MRKILVIGIGAGDPEYLTIQAVKALNEADVFFIPDKGAEKIELLALRKDICERFITDKTYRWVEFEAPVRASNDRNYRERVAEWHGRLEESYERLLTEHLDEGECGAFLVWGDPTLYDSTLRIIEAVRARGLALEFEVIPGISSVQALAAKHRIPLNRIGEPVLITTGRKLAEGMPDGADSVVVMLDGEQAFKTLGGADLEIFWGAYLGTEHEILISGKVSEVMGAIDEARRQARKRHGWIMDTYLLRRPERD